MRTREATRLYRFDWSAVRILHRDANRHAIAELGGVGDLVHAGDVVGAARKGIGAASRIALPRRVEGRDRTTEREASELDERVVHAE